MTFVLRMLRREIRGSWGRLGVFFVSVGIGVAAIVVLRSVVQTVRTTLTREARALVGADVTLRSQRPMADDVRSRIAGVLTTVPEAVTTDMVETQTMAAAASTPGGRVRLVEVRGVEAEFPFYGAIELQDGRYSHARLANHGAIVQPELLAALRVRNGDAITLAGTTFTIRGIIATDRVQRGGIAWGPRVYVDLADLRATSLLGFGSRATYQVMARVPAADVDGVTTRLRDALRADFVTVRSWHMLEDRLGENLTLAENYLSLVGFAIVVLGGIGVWSVTRVIVQQKIPSVAILKCLGASSAAVLAVYVLQMLALAGVGSLIGVATAAVCLAFVPARVIEPLGVSTVSITWSAAAQGVAVGLLVSLTFALVPLLEIRDVKPLRLLRGGLPATARARDWPSRAAAVISAVALVAVAMWQAQSVRAGLYVVGGLAIVGAALYAASHGLVRAVRPLMRSRHFALRHAVVSLSRPGGQARVVLMAVGLGCFFVLGVRALQANLLHQLTTQVGEHSPDFVLIDIQDDQVDGVRTIVGPFARGPVRIMPLMRGRVVAIAGAHGTRTLEDIRTEGRLTREFGLTFREGLEPNERVVAGEFWPSADSRDPGVDTDVSVEKQASVQGGLDLGDLMTFDVAGQRLTARVTSVRTVEWDDSQNGGFVFVLRPSPAVAAAAHSHVGFVQIRDDEAARAGLQRALVDRFPNVSAIDVRDVIATIRAVVDNVAAAISVVGAVTLVGGAFILVGAVLMTRFQRLYDAAIYRTLGASTRLVAAMVAVEYGVLGLLAGMLGAAGALGLSWALARFLFEIDWQPAPGLLLAGTAASATIVGLVGLLASADVLIRKPLATLRGE